MFVTVVIEGHLVIYVTFTVTLMMFEMFLSWQLININSSLITELNECLSFLPILHSNTSPVECVEYLRTLMCCGAMWFTVLRSSPAPDPCQPDGAEPQTS